MRIVVLAASALLLSVSAASATDLINQDGDAYEVTLTSAEGTHTIEIAPASEMLDICNGCAIALEGSESVDAKTADVITIVDGALSVKE